MTDFRDDDFYGLSSFDYSPNPYSPSVEPASTTSPSSFSSPAEFLSPDQSADLYATLYPELFPSAPTVEPHFRPTYSDYQPTPVSEFNFENYSHTQPLPPVEPLQPPSYQPVYQPTASLYQPVAEAPVIAEPPVIFEPNVVADPRINLPHTSTYELIESQLGQNVVDTTAIVPGQSDAVRPRKKRSRVYKSLAFTLFRDAVVVVLLAILVGSLVRGLLVMPFYVPLSSMAQTLQVDDRIFVNRLKGHVIGLDRGNVIVFKDTAGWLYSSKGFKPQSAGNIFQEAGTSLLKFTGFLPEDGDEYLVKRLIGLPGDHVSCAGPGSPLVINGKIIDNEPYLAPGMNASEVEFDVHVPQGMLWVMGDNRSHSADSRYNMDKAGNGFVKVDDVVGSVFWIGWPSNRMQLLENYTKYLDAP